jgi:hypothetical protein
MAQSKRKGWDATIKNVAKASGASAATLRGGVKRETRKRLNARKWLHTSANDTEEQKLRVEARLEMLQDGYGYKVWRTRALLHHARHRVVANLV